MDQKKNENKVLKFLEDKKNRSRLYTVLFIVAFGIFFIVNNSGNEPKSGPYPPNYNPSETSSVKEIAANFTLNSIEGEKISLDDYKGKVVIIDFWATWCGPCRKGIPDLVELKNTYGEKGFEIIGISVDRSNTIDQVDQFAKDYKINYPVVYTDEQTPGKYGGIQYIPTSFVVDQEGYIISKHVGYVEKSQYVSEIESLFKK